MRGHEQVEFVRVIEAAVVVDFDNIIAVNESFSPSAVLHGCRESVRDR